LIHQGDRTARETTFGGFGILRFVVDDTTELITIYDLVWAG
jgi:hypothetical protein